jgi:hypothetical protein
MHTTAKRRLTDLSAVRGAMKLVVDRAGIELLTGSKERREEAHLGFRKSRVIFLQSLA